MIHKDGRHIWIQSKRFTIVIALPIGRSWMTGKRHGLSINIYTQP